MVRKDLNMRKGKIAAQVAHAAMKFIFDGNVASKLDEIYVKLSKAETKWAREGFTKIVVSVDSEQELLDLCESARRNKVASYKIIDSGRTEFDNVPTLTCASFGPDDENLLDKVTGHLKLL